MQKGVTTVLFCLFCFITIFMLPFIVCDLYFSYNNTSACLDQQLQNYSISFTLRTWLQVEGYGNLAVLVAFLLAALASLISAEFGGVLLICTICGLVFYSIFRLAWLIIGAIMFWGQLYPAGTCDRTISDYMFALLIISFIGVFCNMCGGNQARNRQAQE